MPYLQESVCVCARMFTSLLWVLTGSLLPCRDKLIGAEFWKQKESSEKQGGRNRGNEWKRERGMSGWCDKLDERDHTTKCLCCVKTERDERHEWVRRSGVFTGNVLKGKWQIKKKKKVNMQDRVDPECCMECFTCSAGREATMHGIWKEQDHSQKNSSVGFDTSSCWSHLWSQRFLRRASRYCHNKVRLAATLPWSGRVHWACLNSCKKKPLSCKVSKESEELNFIVLLPCV